jgi:hypothetical protein
MRRVFVSERVRVRGEWRRLHNEELYVVYSSSHNIRVIKSIRMRWAGHVTRLDRRVVHTGFWYGKKPLGKPRRRWENDIKMDLQKIGWVAGTRLIWRKVGTCGGLW